ncbi:MAG: restriction endonuclease subunit S [Zavarzinella sp.]|nr:restriction endonuclease subunit S [Zavarzinella sp.]
MKAVRHLTLGEVVKSADPGFACGEHLPTGVVQLRMNNVSVSGGLDWSALRRVPASDSQLKKHSLASGDVVFNHTNSPELVGKTALFTGFREPVLYSNHFLRLRVDKEVLHPRYLALWLNFQWKNRVFEKLCTQWVNQAAVRRDDLLELEILLPDPTEQQRIAAILERADRLRGLRRFGLETTDQVLQSAFSNMFDGSGAGSSWPVVELEEVAEVQGGITLNSRRQQMPLQKPYLRVANVQAGVLDLREVRLVGLTEDEFRKTRLERGDLLLVEGNGNPNEVGRGAIWEAAVPECVHQNHLIRVRCQAERVLPEFLLALVNGRHGREYFLRVGKTTSGLFTISTSVVNSMPIPLPPLALQGRFRTLAKGVVNLRATHREALRQADHLFQALLQRAFTTGL